MCQVNKKEIQTYVVLLIIEDIEMLKVFCSSTFASYYF